MSNLQMLVVDKKKETKVMNELENFGATFFLTCRAKQKFTSIWKSDEKVVIFTTIESNKMDELKTYCFDELNFKNNNTGVLITLDGGGEMRNNSLVVVVTPAGWTEPILTAMKEAGSTGATVIDAKGTGANFKSFLGYNIGTEKEIIFTVVDSKITETILQAAEDSAKKENINVICFTLPVTDFISASK